jgi:hypothetical protein
VAVVVSENCFCFVNVLLLKHNFFTFFTIIDCKMFTTDSSVRMFELILMSGRNSRTPICDKKKEEAVESLEGCFYLSPSQVSQLLESLPNLTRLLVLPRWNRELDLWRKLYESYAKKTR